MCNFTPVLAVLNRAASNQGFHTTHTDKGGKRQCMSVEIYKGNGQFTTQGMGFLEKKIGTKFKPDPEWTQGCDRGSRSCFTATLISSSVPGFNVAVDFSCDKTDPSNMKKFTWSGMRCVQDIPALPGAVAAMDPVRNTGVDASTSCAAAGSQHIEPTVSSSSSAAPVSKKQKSAPVCRPLNVHDAQDESYLHLIFQHFQKESDDGAPVSRKNAENFIRLVMQGRLQFSVDQTNHTLSMYSAVDKGNPGKFTPCGFSLFEHVNSSDWFAVPCGAVTITQNSLHPEAQKLMTLFSRSGPGPNGRFTKLRFLERYLVLMHSEILEGDEPYIPLMRELQVALNNVDKHSNLLDDLEAIHNKYPEVDVPQTYEYQSTSTRKTPGANWTVTAKSPVASEETWGEQFDLVSQRVCHHHVRYSFFHQSSPYSFGSQGLHVGFETYVVPWSVVNDFISCCSSISRG